MNPSFQVYAVTPASAESKPQPVECSILLFFQFVPLRDEGEGDKNRYIGSGVTSICIDILKYVNGVKLSPTGGNHAVGEQRKILQDDHPWFDAYSGLKI